jgi:hypothetical protein
MSSNFTEKCFSVVLAAAVATMAGAARANENVGVASYVRNDVNGVLPNRTALITVGESVLRDEIVKTASDSAAKVVFTDNTNLSIGPNSVVKLDKFVFSGESNYQKATINLAKGALRFATGSSDKHAYEVKSPVATIGVRGTIFEASFTPGSGEGRKEKCDRREAERNNKDKKCKLKCDDIPAGEARKIEGASGRTVINVIEGVVHYCSYEASGQTTPNQMIDCTGAMCSPEMFAQVQPPGFGALALPAALLVIGGGIGGGLASQPKPPPPWIFVPSNPASPDGSPVRPRPNAD